MQNHTPTALKRCTSRQAKLLVSLLRDGELELVRHMFSEGMVDAPVALKMADFIDFAPADIQAMVYMVAGRTKKSNRKKHRHGFIQQHS